MYSGEDWVSGTQGPHEPQCGPSLAMGIPRLINVPIHRADEKEASGDKHARRTPPGVPGCSRQLVHSTACQDWTGP